MITDLLDLSKIQAGKLTLSVVPVSVESVCQASLMCIHHQALKKRIQVVSPATRHFPAFQTDGLRLKQILMNFIHQCRQIYPGRRSRRPGRDP